MILKSIEHLMQRNQNWASSIKEKHPDFFLQLSEQQSPEYLWIGCSDSRVPANQIIDLPPGEVFVHRNIANVVVHTDLNCLSVIQYAVEVLKIKHIIVCGHYGCGGVKASMEDQQYGLIDNWLQHIKDVQRIHASELKSIENENEKFNRLCELNVIEQVKHVANTAIIQYAWKKGYELSVHGWIYSIKNGVIRDLDVTLSGQEEQV
ncbi:carbonate dehydratase [Aliikangiella maris]|uniref:Carbonic anhydrase n=2 Tax=Aliikangiella maris TaxID=3162458 RepID=A0ABV3MS33_9GAMM